MRTPGARFLLNLSVVSHKPRKPKRSQPLSPLNPDASLISAGI